MNTTTDAFLEIWQEADDSITCGVKAGCDKEADSVCIYACCDRSVFMCTHHRTSDQEFVRRHADFQDLQCGAWITKDDVTWLPI